MKHKLKVIDSAAQIMGILRIKRNWGLSLRQIQYLSASAANKMNMG